MRNFRFIGLGIALATIESLVDHLLPFESFTPDLVLPLILYMGLLGFNPARGASIAFVIGYFVDALQPGSPICLHMFLLVGLFLLSRLLTARLLLAGTVFHVSLVLVGSVVASLIIIGLRAIFERHVGELVPMLIIIATRAAATAVITPFIFALARKLDVKRTPRREERLLL